MELNKKYQTIIKKYKGYPVVTLVGAGTDKEDVYRKGAYEILGTDEMEKIFNGLLFRSGANRKEIVGNINEAYQEFKKAVNVSGISNVEDMCSAWEEWFKDYYAILYNVSKARFIDYVVDSKKKELKAYHVKCTKTIEDNIRQTALDYYEHLMFFITPFDLCIEKIILNNLSQILRQPLTIEDGDIEKGIDGRIGDIPYSVAPDSLKKVNVEESVILIKYKKDYEDVKFTVFDGDSRLLKFCQ